MIDQFHFLRPLWLLLLPLIVFAWWQARKIRTRSQLSSQQLAPHLLAAMTLSESARHRLLPQDTLAALLVLACLGVAGPAWRLEISPWFAERAPLVVAVKVGQSMRSNDLLPNRLERARFKIEDLLEARTGARTALIAYAGSAHVVMPPTEDVAVITPFLESLDPALMPVAGDAVIAALERGEMLLKDHAGGGTILLVTDSLPASAADALSEFTARQAAGVVLLLLGTVEGGVALMPDGTVARNDDGTAVQTRVVHRDIEAVARRAGIAVVPFSHDDSDLRRLLREITSNQQQAADADARYRDEAWFLVFPALLLGLYGFRRGWTL